MKTFDALLGKIAYTLWDAKEGGQRLAEYKRLHQQEHFSREALAELQTSKLNQLVAHAYKTSSWYRDIMDNVGINPKQPLTLDDLRKFPITTKAEIRENTDAFISTRYAKSELNSAKTGGSTGVSLNLFFDERCQQLRNAAQMYADGFADWRPGLRVAAVWGNPPVAKTFKQKLRAYLLERMIFLDTMDLNSSSMGAFVQRWQSFQPQVVFGHAHSIYIFAKFLVEQQIQTLRPRGVVTTSMMLLEHERTVI